MILLWNYWLNFNTFTAQEIFKEALYAKDLRLKILKGKPGAGLHKNNLENNQNTGESNLEIHANEVEIGEKNNKKTEMAAGTKITSAVHANNTRKIGKILKISLRKGKKSSNKKDFISFIFCHNNLLIRAKFWKSLLLVLFIGKNNSKFESLPMQK